MGISRKLSLFIILGVVVVSCGLVLSGRENDHSVRSDLTITPIALTAPKVVNPSDIVTLLERDSIRAIDEPKYEPVASADKNIRPDERIIGLIINGEARAYPIPVLSSHEIVNDVVGGEPVAITWCPLCYTALVFSRRMEGKDQLLTFGVSGKLLYNTLVMFDRQTDTLWSQLYGYALQGPLKGKSLKVFPSIHTEWAVWKTHYPHTLVLSKTLTCEQFGCGSYGNSARFNYEADPYVSYYNTPQEGVVDAQIPREAEIPKTKKRVLGVRHSGRKRAYPFEIFTSKRVINDSLAGQPILVWFEPESQTGGAFVRKINDRTLTFYLDADVPGYLIDNETGSRWHVITGEAVSGKLTGHKLQPIFSTTAFEFGWLSYFPDSDLYIHSP